MAFKDFQIKTVIVLFLQATSQRMACECCGGTSECVPSKLIPEYNRCQHDRTGAACLYSWTGLSRQGQSIDRNNLHGIHVEPAIQTPHHHQQRRLHLNVLMYFHLYCLFISIPIHPSKSIFPPFFCFVFCFFIDTDYRFRAAGWLNDGCKWRNYESFLKSNAFVEGGLCGILCKPQRITTYDSFVLWTL